MKRRTHKKRRAIRERAQLRSRLRDLDRHDRAFIVSFMRAVILTLARNDIGVDSKLGTLASAARLLAPAIRQASQVRSHEEQGTEKGEGR